MQSGEAVQPVRPQRARFLRYDADTAARICPRSTDVLSHTFLRLVEPQTHSAGCFHLVSVIYSANTTFIEGLFDSQWIQK